MSNDAFNARLARLGAQPAADTPAPVEAPAARMTRSEKRTSGLRGAIIVATLVFGGVILGSAAAIAFPNFVLDVLGTVAP